MKGEFKVSQDENLIRLDLLFSQHFPDITRSRIKNLIDEGCILYGGKSVKAGEKVKEGKVISYDFEDAKPLEVTAQDVDFEIVYEDEHLLVVNKPQGLVVHPCSSTKDRTLVNGLLARVKDLSGINGVLRPGIVHRLDKNTSGLMVVAKNDFSHKSLAQQIKDKTCHRKYIALCHNIFKNDEGEIDTFIERNKKDRKKMAVSDSGKRAITEFKVIQRFENKTLVEFNLKTGRTHQIRVHCAYKNHPIVGDDVYGKVEKGLAGQLLHSYYLSFVHPKTGEKLEFTASLPQYFKNYLAKLGFSDEMCDNLTKLTK